MDNQHLRSEEDKVQRLSHKGVLSNIKSYIIWETPPIQNKIYIYALKSSIDKVYRYIGITNNPKTRLCHHIIDKNLSHKSSWIKSVLNKNESIEMIIFDYADNLEDALNKEEYYINKYDNLTNLILQPTQPNSKICYIFNIENNNIMEFQSLSSAAFYCGVSPSALLYNNIIKNKYLFNYNKDFISKIDNIYTIKAKRGDEILKFISYKHAALNIGCSVGMINSCVGKIRNNVKGWIFCKRNEEFHNIKLRETKKVICLDDNKSFNSIIEASNYYNIDASSIVKCCKGKRKSISKLKFKYFE